MDMKLEVVVMPVSDVDRAKAFYEQVGFHPDVDHRAGDDLRVVQLTPPGSACSVTIGTGITDAPPRVHQGLHLVVSDIGHPGPISSPEVSRSASSSTSAPRAGSRGPSRAQRSRHLRVLERPDGNTWLVQEVPSSA